MKRYLILAFFVLAMLAASCNVASAQTLTGNVPVKWVSALPATCVTTNRARVLVYKYTATSGMYYCSSANTWTQVVGSSSFAGVILGPNGTALAPTFSFVADTNTGMFRSGADALGFTTGGTERATLSSAGLFSTTGGLSSTTGTFTGVVNAADGTAAAPSYSFGSAGNTDNGMFLSAANSLGFSTAGTERWIINSSGALNPLTSNTLDIGGSTLIRDLGIARTITSTQGTITTSNPFATHTATWNDGAVTFSNIFSNITDTASAAASKLIDLQVGGSSKFNVNKSGGFTLGPASWSGTAYLFEDTAASGGFNMGLTPSVGGAGGTGSFNVGNFSGANSTYAYLNINDTAGAANLDISFGRGAFFANYSQISMSGTTGITISRAKTRTDIFTDDLVVNNYSANAEFRMNMVPGTSGSFKVGDHTTTPTNFLTIDQATGIAKLAATANVEIDSKTGILTVGDANDGANGTKISITDSTKTISVGSVAADVILEVDEVINFKYLRTLTAAGTTGAQTIDKPFGSVNFAALATTLVVTSSIASETSLIFVTPQKGDATCTHFWVERAAGTFTITANAGCTAETPVAFHITN